MGASLSLLWTLNVTNFTQGSNFDTLEDKQGQCKSWDWVQQYCRAWQMCIWQIWNVVIFKGTPCRSKFLEKSICWIILFRVKAHQVVVNLIESQAKILILCPSDSIWQVKKLSWATLQRRYLCFWMNWFVRGWMLMIWSLPPKDASCLLPFSWCRCSHWQLLRISMTVFEWVESCSDAGDQGWKRRG